jgi:cellulose synthase/poly-beta-1,6-N-acetylglucosamine synthase-like glycosyltransferase
MMNSLDPSMAMALTMFWSSILFVFYAYLGYPLLLWILSSVRNRPIQKSNVTPTVTLIITAYNEETRIQQKLENTLKLTYPCNLLQVIVASDCSNDRTDEIARSFQAQGIQLVRAPKRQGKEATQKLTIDHARGEILVFSDVATSLPVDAVTNIVKNFSDPSVGCVSSIDRFIDRKGKPTGEGFYVRYEMFLRSLETKVNTLVGLSGSFFAARREVCQHWPTDLQSDFNTLLNSVRLGLRGVSDPESVGYYQDLADERKEFQRKTRTVLRGITVLMMSWPMLNPLKYGLFSWQLFSHKLCRWLVPFALSLALGSNFPLAWHSSFYAAFLILQLMVYCHALITIWIDVPNSHLLKLSSFFLMVNWSILQAWCRYFRGERLVSWESSKR